MATSDENPWSPSLTKKGHVVADPLFVDYKIEKNTTPPVHWSWNNSEEVEINQNWTNSLGGIFVLNGLIKNCRCYEVLLIIVTQVVHVFHHELSLEWIEFVSSYHYNNVLLMKHSHLRQCLIWNQHVENISTLCCGHRMWWFGVKIRMWVINHKGMGTLECTVTAMCIQISMQLSHLICEMNKSTDKTPWQHDQ